MVLDQLVLAAALSFAPPSHDVSYASILSKPIYDDRPAHELVLNDYGVARAPFELVFEDTMPGARTDTITDAEGPRQRYRLW